MSTGRRIFKKRKRPLLLPTKKSETNNLAFSCFVYGKHGKSDKHGDKVFANFNPSRSFMSNIYNYRFNNKGLCFIIDVSITCLYQESIA